MMIPMFTGTCMSAEGYASLPGSASIRLRVSEPSAMAHTRAKRLPELPGYFSRQRLALPLARWSPGSDRLG